MLTGTQDNERSIDRVAALVEPPDHAGSVGVPGRLS